MVQPNGRLVFAGTGWQRLARQSARFQVLYMYDIARRPNPNLIGTYNPYPAFLSPNNAHLSICGLLYTALHSNHFAIPFQPKPPCPTSPSTLPPHQSKYCLCPGTGRSGNGTHVFLLATFASFSFCSLTLVASSFNSNVMLVNGGRMMYVCPLAR